MSTQAVTMETPIARPADLSAQVVVVFIDFLTNLFLHVEGYEFNVEDIKTKIMISDKFADVLDAVGKKPALVTDLKSIAKQDAFMDDRAGYFYKSGNMFGGKEVRSYLYNTILLIHCISSNQWESRHLSYLVGMGIQGFEKEIRTFGKFFDVNVPIPVGEPVKLVTASKGRIWSTPVTVQIAIEDSMVKSIIQSELFSKLKFGIKVDGEDMPGC